MHRRPNLLYLYSDEQRWDAIGCNHDGRGPATPALDRLAATATNVPRCYATQPVCTPSRASMLTGLWPHQCAMEHNNSILPAGVRCLPELLPPGWSAAHHGKWHLGDEVYAQHGFGEWQATEDTYHDFLSPGRDPLTWSAYDRWLRAHGLRPDPVEIPGREAWVADRFFRDQIHALPEERSRPAFLAESAARFIREHRDEPWVLYVNFLEPHMPFHSCRDRQYDPLAVRLPANADAPPAADHARRAVAKAAELAAKGFQGERLADEADWRRLTARYWGMCSLVDTAVGGILAALEASGTFDDTCIVYTSDHGDMMGSHRLLGKSFAYEESARVPFLFKAPGQRAARRCDGAFSHIDLVPTLLDALGAPPAGGLPGRSRLAELRSGGELAGDVFHQWHGDDGPEEDTRSIVMADGWRYTHAAAGDHELFDLRTDPGERINRAADPAQADRVARARARLAAWQRSAGDPRHLDLEPQP